MSFRALPLHTLLATCAVAFVCEAATGRSTSAPTSAAEPWPMPFWVQWHGKGVTDCPDLDAFLTCGGGKSTDGASYSGGGAPCAITLALAKAVVSASQSITAGTGMDNSCNLRAYTNVFGRFVNGIAADKLCEQGLAAGVLPNGRFIHVEQSIRLRAENGVPGPSVWVQPLKTVFRAQCAEGLAESPDSLMCERTEHEEGPGPVSGAASTTLPPPPRISVGGFIDCLSGYTFLAEVSKCYQSHYAPSSYWQAAKYPSVNEADDLRTVMRALLESDGGCSSLELGSSIAAHMSLSVFTDGTYGIEYCVLMDKSDADGDNVYDRGFGMVAVANHRRNIHRYLVYSGPHPITDKDTELQVMLMLVKTGAHAAVISGVRRDVVKNDSTCHPSYWCMDGAHNVANAFHVLLTETWRWYKDKTSN